MGVGGRRTVCIPGRVHFTAAPSPFCSLSMVAHGGQKLCPTEHVPDRKQIFHTSLDNPQMDFFFFAKKFLCGLKAFSDITGEAGGYSWTIQCRLTEDWDRHPP